MRMFRSLFACLASLALAAFSAAASAFALGLSLLASPPRFAGHRHLLPGTPRSIVASRRMGLA